MKTKLHPLLMLALIVLTVARSSYAAEPKRDYPPNAARDALETACQKASAESKMVFLKSGYPECGWCVIFDRYHSYPEVREIIEKYYVVVAIDTIHMPDGEEVFSRYAKPGSPSWVILNARKEVIVDSYSSAGEIGYPNQPAEKAYYAAALKKATPTISDGEVQELFLQLARAAKKTQPQPNPALERTPTAGDAGSAGDTPRPQ